VTSVMRVVNVVRQALGKLISMTKAIILIDLGDQTW